MKLRSKPAAPREKTWIIVAVGRVDPKWEPYLGGLTGDLLAASPA